MLDFTMLTARFANFLEGAFKRLSRANVSCAGGSREQENPSQHRLWPRRRRVRCDQRELSALIDLQKVDRHFRVAIGIERDAAGDAGKVFGRGECVAYGCGVR